LWVNQLESLKVNISQIALALSRYSRLVSLFNMDYHRSIMKKHRRTDSEEQAMFGKAVERAGSMRRITTDPNHKLGGEVASGMHGRAVGHISDMKGYHSGIVSPQHVFHFLSHIWLLPCLRFS
jgi:hypothetical protein